jgi:hypothetical protein
VHDDIKHLTRYLRLLFQPEKSTGPKNAPHFNLRTELDSENPTEENAPLQSHFVD